MSLYRYNRHAMQTFQSFRLSVQILISGILVTLSAACSTDLNVSTRYVPDFDPTLVQSFSIVPTDLSLRPSWVDAQIEMDVEAVLKAKGYTPDEYLGADLLISFQVQRRESYALQIPGRREESRSITFDEGSLTLEIRNSFNQQIFRGVARGVVATTKEETRARLQDAVNQLLDEFPEKE